MRYADIISEDAAAGTGFVLAPGLDPKNYQITDSMKDVEQSWKAMTYVGEGRVEKGEMGQVGYVWISLKDNTIIPISRGDEHHEGGDMVHYLINKKKLKINMGDYVRFFAWGNNYIYYREDAPKWVAACKKFLAWGGKEGIMKGANSERGLLLNYSQFVAANGIKITEAGKLAPLGQQFYNHYKQTQDAILAARGTENKAALLKPFKEAAALLTFVASLSYHLEGGPGLDEMKAQSKALREVTKARDLEALTELIFGFNSIKRKVHEEIRNVKPADWAYESMVGFWGDLPFAENLLAHL